MTERIKDHSKQQLPPEDKNKISDVKKTEKETKPLIPSPAIPSVDFTEEQIDEILSEKDPSWWKN